MGGCDASSQFFGQSENATATGDDGVACTFLRRGVAATLRRAGTVTKLAQPAPSAAPRASNNQNS